MNQAVANSAAEVTSAQSVIESLGKRARQAATILARSTTYQKNQALLAMADALLADRDTILQANQKDLENGRNKGLDDALLDRLELTDSRFEAMVEGLKQVASLPDPVGELTNLRQMPSGIEVGQMRVPLGVIGIIYESRPNVTIDAASLCLKSGNATILRGGSESLHSNLAIGKAVQTGLKNAGLPEEAVQVIDSPDRALVGALIQAKDWVDVIVPRGGNSLVARIDAEAKVPVIKHLDGICHVYVDDEADLEKALAVAVNAKTQRYGTCNTTETLLVAKPIAGTFLPQVARLLVEKGVELRACEHSYQILDQHGVKVLKALEEDWHCEYLAPILSIKCVEGMEEAITHINHYGSHHTDAMITQSYTKSRQFVQAVDSSSVMINTSTRFADGFEYGLGAEIGISTDKLHARGPVGLQGLTSQKYVVYGDGHIRV